jgi:hypothetical protein
MPKFRKKPVIIDAIQITEPIQIETLEGTLTGNPGDWLITGIKGEKYPCKPDVFFATYEPTGAEALEEWEKVYGLQDESI